MNKAFCKKRCISSLILAVCLIFFNLSCGLDTIYVLDDIIEAPDGFDGQLPSVNHKPDCSSIDYADNYFEFIPAKIDDPKTPTYGNIRIFGTEVYYKIYKSAARLNTEADDLISISNKSDSSSAAAEKLVQTYKFKPLRGEGYEDKTVFFPIDEINRFEGKFEYIRIRLNEFTIYPAQITVTYSKEDANKETIYTDYKIYNAPSNVKPVRNISGGTKFFNFKSNADSSSSNAVPESNDEDVNTSGTSSDSDWYVSMFVVAQGRDETYSPVYSTIKYLGSVRIPIE